MMIIHVEKDDLICLLRGISPSYAEMEWPECKANGQYYGGHHDMWQWNYLAFEDMSEQQCYDLYRNSLTG